MSRIGPQGLRTSFAGNVPAGPGWTKVIDISSTGPASPLKGKRAQKVYIQNLSTTNRLEIAFSKAPGAAEIPLLPSTFVILDDEHPADGLIHARGNGAIVEASVYVSA